MLLNCKNEELIKYSKGTYNKEKFIQSIKDNWELTDKQIRMAYLISDLAENAVGVFSVAHSTFVKMFEERFDMKISLSSVRRFFGLLSEIGVLSINAAKRKNNKQSANIYIVEPQIENEQPEEHLEEQPCEQLDEQDNITLNKAINRTLNTPLNNNFVNKELVNKDEIIYKLTNEYRLKGMPKDLCLRVVNEVLATDSIQNFGAYLRTCLENTLHRRKIRRGEIDPVKNMKERHERAGIPFFDWLNA